MSHSNSTRDINSGNSNIEKYLKKKINQLQNSYNFNNLNNQAKPIIKHEKSKSKISNNNLIPPSSSKGPTSASININNYYTNNIYNAIYNNFMPHQVYNKNNNVKKKINHQRASSVLAPKRSSSKIQSNKKKVKGEQNNYKHKDNKKFNIPNRKISRTNSTNKISARIPNDYIFNKIQSISVYNAPKKI